MSDIDAWCSGRTILTRTNSWKVDLGPMLPSSEPLRNALLAMACTYILDYSRDERLRDRANAYYYAAVKAVGKKMQDPKEWEVGKGDDLVGTFVLLSMHDVSKPFYIFNRLSRFLGVYCRSVELFYL